jgi:heterotetrameric sarcosine oxidase gamma subunit
VADLGPRPRADAPPDMPPVARSPIPTRAPTIVDGWEVTDRRSEASLQLADLSALAKVQVRAAEDGPLSAALGVDFLGVARDEHGVLVTGSGPGEWTLIGPIGSAGAIAERIALTDVRERVTVTDLTHGRALMRLSGEAGPEVLATMCGIDLDDRSTPNASCLRSSVAKVTTDIVRDDHDTRRSYLMHCDRSSGRYLFETLLEAGRTFGLDVTGPSDGLGI